MREFGIDVYTHLYLKWTTNRDLLQSTGNSAPCHKQSGWEGSWGRMDAWIRVAESLYCSPETITALLSALLQYKIKSFSF